MDRRRQSSSRHSRLWESRVGVNVPSLTRFPMREMHDNLTLRHPAGGVAIEPPGGRLMSDVLSTVPASAPKNGVSRRQLVKAGVWAAPAVAVAIAAPASAVSVSGATLSGTQQAGEA